MHACLGVFSLWLAGVSSFDEKITIFQLEPAWKLLEKKEEDDSREPDEEDGEKVSVKKKVQITGVRTPLHYEVHYLFSEPLPLSLLKFLYSSTCLLSAFLRQGVHAIKRTRLA